MVLDAHKVSATKLNIMGYSIDIIVDMDCGDVKRPIRVGPFGNLQFLHVIVGTIIGFDELGQFLEQILLTFVVGLRDNSLEELILFMGGIECSRVLLFAHKQIFVAIDQSQRIEP